jgi:hypothetical protein
MARRAGTNTRRHARPAGGVRAWTTASDRRSPSANHRDGSAMQGRIRKTRCRRQAARAPGSMSTPHERWTATAGRAERAPCRPPPPGKKRLTVKARTMRHWYGRTDSPWRAGRAWMEARNPSRPQAAGHCTTCRMRRRHGGSERRCAGYAAPPAPGKSRVRQTPGSLQSRRAMWRNTAEIGSCSWDFLRRKISGAVDGRSIVNNRIR